MIKKYVSRGDLKFEMNCFTSSTIIEVASDWIDIFGGRSKILMLRSP